MVNLTKKELKDYINKEIHKLETNTGNNAYLRAEYEGLLRNFESSKLTKSKLERKVNDGLNWLIDMQRAEMKEKRLGEGPKKLYSELRSLYYGLIEEFDLRRIRE